MEKTAEQLVVRQYERYTCALPAVVGITADSPARVALSRTAGNGTGVLAATVVDCSAGGIGLQCLVFLPRQTRVLVRIDLADAAPLELEGTVQRAAMISRDPKYYLGVAFKGKNSPHPTTVERLLNHISAMKPLAGGTAA